MDANNINEWREIAANTLRDMLATPKNENIQQMKTPVSFRIPSDLYTKIKARAEKESRTVTSMIIYILTQSFK